jgi:hypothetical protein
MSSLSQISVTSGFLSPGTKIGAQASLTNQNIYKPGYVVNARQTLNIHARPYSSPEDYVTEVNQPFLILTPLFLQVRCRIEDKLEW